MKLVYTERPKGFNPKVEVVSCFIKHGDQILLLHRADNKPQGNTWGLPAGKVIEGEDLYNAMSREIEEEIGIKIHPKELNYQKEVYVRYPEVDFVYHRFCWETSENPEIILNKEEHKDYKWLTPTEALLENLIPGEDECIRLFYNLK